MQKLTQSSAEEPPRHSAPASASFRGGFTLLEVLLAVALVALIAALGIPLYQSYQTRNDLDIAAVSLVHSLRRAQLLAQAMDGDSPWGVSVQGGRITLFRGASYGARNPAFDERTEVPAALQPSGAQAFVFSKFTGEPQATGTLTFTAANSEARSVTVNEQGTVTY